MSHNNRTLKRIQLALARSKDFPSGSALIGYDFIAPLNRDGHINIDAWRQSRPDCVVRHFATGRDDAIGMLVHKSGGRHGRWVFDYDVETSSDDDVGYGFETHAFVPGEYVSILGPDDKQRTYSVVAVDDLD
jgi:hypothetical protein